MGSKNLNMHEAKTHLSKHVAKLRPGDRIVLCRRNKPVAEIRPLPPSRVRRRPIGLMKGAATIAPSFWEPLPADVQAAFEGRGL